MRTGQADYGLEPVAKAKGKRYAFWKAVKALDQGWPVKLERGFFVDPEGARFGGSVRIDQLKEHFPLRLYRRRPYDRPVLRAIRIEFSVHTTKRRKCIARVTWELAAPEQAAT